MNKIIVKKDQIDFSSVDGIQVQKIEPAFVPTFHLILEKNMVVGIEYEETIEKLDLTIEILPSLSVTILELQELTRMKKQTHYIVKKNAHLTVERFYDTTFLQECDVVDLKEENAHFSYLLKTIATNQQTFDMKICHQASHTISEVYHHGVANKKGALAFHISSIVHSGMKDCVVTQSSKIITNHVQLCKINPILLIEEQEVEANHSAFLGTFEDILYFYLESRGIPRKQAEYLLIKGFLLSNLKVVPEWNEKIHKKIQENWR